MTKVVFGNAASEGANRSLSPFASPKFVCREIPGNFSLPVAFS
jgi:hypothetical protein